jgi:hypothetical protein
MKKTFLGNEVTSWAKGQYDCTCPNVHSSLHVLFTTNDFRYVGKVKFGCTPLLEVEGKSLEDVVLRTESALIRWAQGIVDLRDS